MACGEIRFLEGGVIKNSSILGGSISYAVMTDCQIDASTLTNLKSLDDASAQTIADALTKLPADKLRSLVKALFDALVLQDGTDAPDTTRMQSLPTLMYGDSRKGMLGSPDAWVNIGNKLIPAYTAADGVTNVG